MCTTQNFTQHVTAQAEMHIFENSVPDFKICAQCFNLSLNYFDIILYDFPSEQNLRNFQALSAEILLFKSFSSTLEI